MIMEFYSFMDEWNRVLGYTTPAHHHRIMEFLVDIVRLSASLRGAGCPILYNLFPTIRCFQELNDIGEGKMLLYSYLITFV